MKKNLLTGFLSMLVICPVFAEVDVSTMTTDAVINKAKEICNKHSDTHFWVENDQSCVPLNACDDSEYRGRYCNKSVFNNIKVSENKAREMVNVYVKRKGLECYADDVVDFSVRCKGRDYRVFKFMYNYDNEEDKNDLFAGACFAFGGKYVEYVEEYNINGIKKGCLLIDEKKCSDLGILVDGFTTLDDTFSCSDKLNFKLYTNDSYPDSKSINQSVCGKEIRSTDKICLM